MRRPNHRRGTVAVIMLALLFLLQIVILVLIRSSQRDSLLGVQRSDTVRAFYAAEAGTNMAVRELMVGADEDGDGVIGTISNDGNDANDPALGVARFFVDSMPIGPDTQYVSHGEAGDARREVEILVE